MDADLDLARAWWPPVEGSQDEVVEQAPFVEGQLGGFHRSRFGPADESRCQHVMGADGQLILTALGEHDAKQPFDTISLVSPVLWVEVDARRVQLGVLERKGLGEAPEQCLVRVRHRTSGRLGAPGHVPHARPSSRREERLGEVQRAHQGPCRSRLGHGPVRRSVEAPQVQHAVETVVRRLRDEPHEVVRNRRVHLEASVGEPTERSTGDRQHAPVTTVGQPTGERVTHAAVVGQDQPAPRAGPGRRRRDLRLGRRGHHDGLDREGARSVVRHRHDLRLAEAFAGQEVPPRVAGQQQRGPSQVAIGEPPPAVGQAEADRDEPQRPNHLHHDQPRAGRHQPGDVREGLP